MKIVTCFLAGGDFKVEHVQRLAKMIPALTCITNERVQGVKALPMRHEWKGWWCKMNAYDPNLFDEDMLLIDLDTTIIRAPELPTQTTVLSDFYRPDLIGSGFVFITKGDRKRIYDEFIKDPQAVMSRCNTREKWGDQGFLQEVIPSAKRWGGNVSSYKLHCKSGAPKSTDVICFHGKPRPWEVE